MSVITSQPVSHNQENFDAEESPQQMSDEELQRARERERERESDCCFDALLCEESDVFCLCHCIALCCRSTSNCTETCFDNCGDCINDCCNADNDTTDADNCLDCASCCSD